MSHLRQVLLGSACMFLLGSTPVRAQQQTQNQDQRTAPIPAYNSPVAGAAANGNTDQGADQQPVDRAPLSSVQGLSVGTESNRSYWQPHMDTSFTTDSNAFETPNSTDWTRTGVIAGGVDIHHVSGISNLTLSSTAGGTFSNQTNIGNGAVVSLNFADRFTFRRYALAFYDQTSYLPESAQGFGGLGAAGGVGGGPPGIAFNPGQNILVGRGQMLNNSDAVELDQYLSARSSLTYAGGYSLLHYFDSGLFDYGVVNARGGYNYQLSKRDTLAVTYTFTDYRYGDSDESLMDHTMQLSYGREITGRFAFQISAGPQILVANTGTGAASGAAAGFTLPTETEYEWSLNSTLQYQKERYSVGIGYSHGVGGGAGVLLGSTTDTVTGNATRRMSRTFSSGLTGGYSHNKGLPGTGATANQQYDYWFGGINLTKPLSESVGITFSYQVQYQTSNGTACVGPACGGDVLRHLISVGVGWHDRPLLF